MAVCYDQLDISSLGCFELLVRRLQVVEGAYDANLTSRIEAAVAVASAAHVAGELGDEATVAEERREARDDAALRDDS